MGKNKVELNEEAIVQQIRVNMANRGIKDTKAYLVFLRDQKIKKRDASKARVKEAEVEILTIDRMLEAVI